MANISGKSNVFFRDAGLLSSREYSFKPIGLREQKVKDTRSWWPCSQRSVYGRQWSEEVGRTKDDVTSVLHKLTYPSGKAYSTSGVAPHKRES